MKVGFARFFLWVVDREICGNQGWKRGLVSIGAEKIVERIQDYAEPLIKDMGLELVDVQFKREGPG